MSVFLSFLSNSEPLPEPERFSGALPVNPQTFPPQIDVFTGNNNRLIVWSWTKLDNPLERRKDGAVHLLGYVPVGAESVEDRFVSVLQGRRTDDCGSFGGVWHKPNSITAYSSLSGSWCFFVRQERDYTAISNRLGLLVALGPVTVREAFMVYMCGTGRSMDFGTAFEEIVTMKPGEVVKVRPEGTTFALTSHKHLFEPFDMPTAVAGLDDLCATMGQCLARYKDAQFNFRLSGGKDSRTLLGLLDEHGYMDIPGKVRALTHTFCHEWEALSVKSQLRLYNHEIQHICFTKPPEELGGVPARIIRTLFIRGAALNLAGVPPSMESLGGWRPAPNTLTLSGLDCTMKNSPNTMPVEAYIHNTRFTLKGKRLLRAEVQEQFMREYRKIMQEELADKDKGYYQQLEGWWVPLSRAHSSLPWVLSPHFSPFLDTTFWKYFLSAPRDFFCLQAVYYLIQCRAKRPIWRVPFADTGWPLELPEFLRRYGLPAEGLLFPAFRFDSRMPGQKAFGVSEPLLYRTDLMRPYLKDRTSVHKQRFEFLNPAVLAEYLETPARQQDYPLLLMGSGLLTSVLLAEYGASLLDRTALPAIEADFSAAVGGCSGLVLVDDNIEPESGAGDKSGESEAALADRLLFIQNLREKLSYIRMRRAPELLHDMGFAPIEGKEGQEHVFDVVPGVRFRLEALVLGPCPYHVEHSPAGTRSALSPVMVVIPDKKDASFADLPRIDSYFGAVIPLQDGIPTEWWVEFTIPEGVHRLACVFLGQEGAQPVYIADVRGTNMCAGK